MLQNDTISMIKLESLQNYYMLIWVQNGSTPTFILEPTNAGIPHITASIHITIAVVIVMQVARFPPPVNG